MIQARKTTNVGLEISPVFTRWQVHCRKCGAMFYVDTEHESTGREIFKLEDIHCGLHPSESSTIELV
jgi:phage terminase large subunit GpA-like protein